MTTTDALYWYWLALITGAVAIITYTLLVRRLAELLQPMRLRMADLGRRLLRSKLSKDDKEFVTFMLTHAFSPWPGFLLSAALPFAVIFFIFQGLVRGKRLGAPNNECSKLAQMATISMLAASPIAAILVVVELLTIGFVGFLVGGNVLVWRAIFAAQRVEAFTASSLHHKKVVV